MPRTTRTGEREDGRRRRHCLKYVSWEEIERWKARARRGVDEGAGAYPFAYGTRDKAFRNVEDAVLWLLTLPRYGGYRLAPSIVARLQIAAVHTRGVDAGETLTVDPQVLENGPVVAVADKAASFYLPLNNAFQVLMDLRFRGPAPPLAVSYAHRDRTHEQTAGPYVSLAGHFQKHRWLEEDSIEPLERFAATVRDGRRAFLSYSRRDFPQRPGEGTSWPEELGAALGARDVSCWWDRWYLPQGENEGEMPKALLHALLDDAVSQAPWFVALVGEAYLRADDESWPRQEWLEARDQLANTGRRHPLNRLTVFFSDPVDDPLHRRWMDADDTVLWTGTDPDPDRVADELEKVISLETRRRLPSSP